MSIAVIKYNAGNIYSVVHALRRLGVEPVVTDNSEEILKADKVIFPGVGEASTTMDYLKKHQLDKLIVSLKQPVLGICLGMQLMCSYSEEGGNVPCLGIFDVPVKLFRPENGEKIPHMGWNSISNLKGKLMANTSEGDYVYFVHSYHVPVCEHTIATCNYIHDFSAAINKDNFYATQFHPEKSGSVGHKILQAFLNL